MADTNPEHNKDLEQPTVFTYGDRFALINASKSIDNIERRLSDMQNGFIVEVKETHSLVNSMHATMTSMNATIISHDKQLTDSKDVPERLTKLEGKVSLYGKILMFACGTILVAFLNEIIKQVIK